MANWKLWLHNHGETGTRTFANITNGPNAIAVNEGLAQITTNSATIDWTLSSAVDIGAVVISNQTCIGGSIFLYYNDGGWQQYGAESSILTGGTEIHTFGTGTTDTQWRVQFANCSSDTIGFVGLYGRDLGYVIEFEDAVPSYPLDWEFDVVSTRQMTGTGIVIEQKHGGPFERFTLNIPYVQRGKVTNEGLIDNTWLLPSHEEINGWCGAITVQDDNEYARLCTRELPLRAPITHAGGRQTIGVTFRTIPGLY